jgi:hypothetical protein
VIDDRIRDGVLVFADECLGAARTGLFVRHKLDAMCGRGGSRLAVVPR